MRIGVLGTGMVGRAIATKLVGLGHEVMMGSRTADNETASEWVASAGAGASQGTFADAAVFGELVFNCTAGTGSLEALEVAGAENLARKTLVDVSNPLDFSQGMTNTVNCEVMVDPAKVPGEHDVFVCGNDETAKAEVVDLLRSFGWPAERIHDLGDISAARGTEAYLLLWLRLRGALQTGHFNIEVVR